MDEPLFNELLESVKQADQIMTDHAELRRLAKRADALHGTPSLEHVFAITKFREAVEPKAILALLDEIDGLLAQHGRDSSELRALCQARDDARKERDRLKAENCAHKDTQKHCEWLAQDLKECASVLPGTYYMDPPDGGNVSIPEQIRRMAKDAARYRWLRERDLETIRQGGVFAGMTPENIVLNLEHLDAAIDAALEGATQ
ncbi:TPA: hypothetical protein L4U07_000567 [Pseudomonas aeruginosa]|uniref:Ead/Ea22-like family protein n=1 Tax=Pseudomonas aeruginosa TaxID=287 RepID=A0A9P1R286_PSEAI|nr:MULTISPECIES: hypothetical protein [Pseudomonas]EIU2683156.1 hypothetical protein [Pseudomonas aeruginosa]EIU3428086.1 hypothetical protein [Pseudomonas aeruginosa]EIY2632436.1 hypothetical protein [Pseudomonas aeruginosa]EJA3279046.1 hypothetical protein [Pseudomonas aeruginosa]EJC0104506.1 hypothetical protein [Pseudomonas aeruginosa]